MIAYGEQVSKYPYTLSTYIHIVMQAWNILEPTFLNVIISAGGLALIAVYVKISSAIYTLAHEFSHYIMAKIYGVEIISFTIGRPCFRWTDNSGTRWGIGVPVGGNVNMLHEFTESANVPEPEASRAFACKSSIQRFIIIAAGPQVSIFLPIFVLLITYLMSDAQELWESGLHFYQLLLVFLVGVTGSLNSLPSMWAVFSLPSDSIIWAGGTWSVIAGIFNLLPCKGFDGKALLNIMVAESERPCTVRVLYYIFCALLVTAIPVIFLLLIVHFGTISKIGA
jgi:membrane-associated protease RseP (regulator of RpoE activity)